jgi:hypothetical protein
MQPLPGQAKPALSIEPQDAYQHVYEEVTALKYNFELTNTGRRRMRILRIRPDCSCSVARLRASELEPGESTTFDVLYNAISIMGKIPKRRIVVQTDDPDCPVVMCSVAGFRERRFVIDPASIDFGTLLYGSAPWHEVTIEANGQDMQLTPERAISDNPWIAIELVQHELHARSGSRLLLRVGLKDKTPVGKIDAQLFIPRVEDDGIGPVIRVRGEISGPVRLVPSSAFMGIMKSGTTAERTVEVRPLMKSNSAENPPAVEVVGFGATPHGIRLGRDESEPAAVRVAADASELGAGRFEHEVAIKCDLGDTLCDVLLRITGMVSP